VNGTPVSWQVQLHDVDDRRGVAGALVGSAEERGRILARATAVFEGFGSAPAELIGNIQGVYVRLDTAATSGGENGRLEAKAFRSDPAVQEAVVAAFAHALRARLFRLPTRAERRERNQQTLRISKVLRDLEEIDDVAAAFLRAGFRVLWAKNGVGYATMRVVGALEGLNAPASVIAPDADAIASGVHGELRMRSDSFDGRDDEDARRFFDAVIPDDPTLSPRERCLAAIDNLSAHG
jgi:hypothetical protein